MGRPSTKPISLQSLQKKDADSFNKPPNKQFEKKISPLLLKIQSLSSYFCFHKTKSLNRHLHKSKNSTLHPFPTVRLLQQILQKIPQQILQQPLQNLLLFSLFFPSVSYGEWDLSASLRLRGTLNHTQNESQLSLLDHTLGGEVTFYPNSSLDFHFLLWSSFQYVTNPSFKQTQLYQASAYGNWNINPEMKLSFGRKPYELQASELISFNEEESYPYMFTGLFFTYSTDSIIFHFWFADLPDLWRGAEQIPSQDQGLGLSLDLNFKASPLERTLLNFSYLPRSPFIDSPFPSRPSDLNSEIKKSIARLSLMIQGAISSFDYLIVVMSHGAEGLKFKFEDEAYHLKLDYSQNDWSGSRFYIGYHKDSLNYDPWLYDRHSQAGLLDLFEWGNLSYFFAGYHVSFLDWFDLELQFFDLSNTQSGPLHLGYYGHFVVPSSAQSNLPQTSLGRELDIKLTKSFSDHLDFTLKGGVFLPSDFLLEFFGDFYGHLQLQTVYKL